MITVRCSRCKFTVTGTDTAAVVKAWEKSGGLMAPAGEGGPNDKEGTMMICPKCAHKAVCKTFHLGV